MDIDFSFSAIMSGLFFSGVGIYFFRMGRKRLNIPVTLMGIALMSYGFLTHGPLQDWGVGIMLSGVSYLLLQNDPGL